VLSTKGRGNRARILGRVIYTEIMHATIEHDLCDEAPATARHTAIASRTCPIETEVLLIVATAAGYSQIATTAVERIAIDVLSLSRIAALKTKYHPMEIDVSAWSLSVSISFLVQIPFILTQLREIGRIHKGSAARCTPRQW